MKLSITSSLVSFLTLRVDFVEQIGNTLCYQGNNINRTFVSLDKEHNQQGCKRGLRPRFSLDETKAESNELTFCVIIIMVIFEKSYTFAVSMTSDMKKKMFFIKVKSTSIKLQLVSG